MLAKDNMSVKAETIKIGGFGVPLTYITEAFSLREEFKLVDHWKRRHIFHVVYPNSPAASVFEKKLNAEEIVKETISSGKEVDSRNKNGVIKKTLKKKFDFKVGESEAGKECFSVLTVIKFVSNDSFDIVTAYPTE